MEGKRPLVFASLPEMVEYYSNPHPDFPYPLESYVILSKDQLNVKLVF